MPPNLMVPLFPPVQCSGSGNSVRSTTYLSHNSLVLVPLEQSSSWRWPLSPVNIQIQSPQRSWITACRFSTLNSPSYSGRGRRHKHRRRPNLHSLRERDHLETQSTSFRLEKSENRNEMNQHPSENVGSDRLPYPKGQPWRVLWPVLDAQASHSKNEESLHRIPRLSDFRRAWALYKETWEDGISGRPSAAKLQRLQEEELLKQLSEETHLQQHSSGKNFDSTAQHPWQDVSDNASRNLHIAREEVQRLLKEAKERTGIHTQDDLKAVATQMMQLGTECIREFMAGYRQGRDQEIDKMLNEYFRDESNDNMDKVQDKDSPIDDNKSAEPNGQGEKKKKRRRPKRGIPRD
jgi:hypothetical protein